MKTNLFFIFVITGISLSLAAFSTKKQVLAVNYIQLQNECKPIPRTHCIPGAPIPCTDTDPVTWNTYPVYLQQSPSESAFCQVLLGYYE